MILFAVCCHSPKCLFREQDGEVQGFAGIEGRNIEGIFAARSSAPRGLEQPYCKRQNGAFHPSRCRFTARTGGLFCFINGEGFSIIKEEMDPDTGEAEYQMVWKKADGKED